MTDACDDDRRLADLVARAQAGDPAAFAALVERYQQPLGGYLQHLVGDVDAALDLAQDTFVRAYRAIGATPPGLLVRPWLYRIATNLAHDHLRRRRRFTWLPLHIVDRFVGGQPMDAIEERALVRQALGRLQPEERAVLLLCGLERLTYAEAAAALGGSAEAVRKRFGRAKARFRAAYGELAGGVAP